MTMPESFNLDCLPTPIGTALLVTDADGLLRALDWEDYEPRMKQLLRASCAPH
jgi:methylated-DNA-[protein]-cysteine S-methyltransferase